MAGLKKIGPNDTISFTLSDRERDLILEEVFDPDNLFRRLQLAVVEEGRATYRFTYGDLDLLLDSIASAANHAEDTRLGRQLDRLYGRLAGLLDDYRVGDDENQGFGEHLTSLGLNKMDFPDMDFSLDSVPLEFMDLLSRVIVAQGGVKSADDLETALQTMFENFTPLMVPDAADLHPAFFSHLITDNLDDQGVIRLNQDLTLKELSKAEILLNAQIFLRAMMDSGGVKATAAGNLTRKFVAKMLDTMNFSDDYVEEVRMRNKAVNEENIMPLHVIRILLDLAGLIRKVKGTFYVTNKHKRFLEDDSAGELFATLFKTHFQELNLAYLDWLLESSLFQDTIGYPLYMLSKCADDWNKPGELISSLILPEVAMEIPHGAGIFDLRVLMAETRLIRPLVSFGLLEKRELPETEKEPFLGHFEVRKTPLFDRFLRFDFDDIPA